MQTLKDRESPAAGGVPPWCQDPKRCEHSTGKAKQCGKCRNIAHLPAEESHFVEGSRSVWVYYPQGMLRRAAAESDLNSARLQSHSFLHECGAAKSAPEIAETAPYPGHSLFQDSFFICKFQKIGDAPGLAEVYVETVVDSFSGIAFAKVYAAESAMNAADIFATRVAPFFHVHGIPIEQVITPGANEYCGIASLHPYETCLAESHIRHVQRKRSEQIHSTLCLQFFGVLRREFFAPALRDRFQHTLETLQRELDVFLGTYNSARPSIAPAMRGKPPLSAFLDAPRV